jgi:adenosylcobinamide kinase/adenosylcobinamide-phosphate guanylyltransferase
MVMITGAAHSGRSRFAESLAADLGGIVAYVATAEAGDDEMARRIQRHRLNRPPDWETVEAPLDAAGAVAGAGTRADVVLVECLGMLVSNWILAGEDADGALDRCQCLLAAARAVPGRVVLVTLEAGWGIVPRQALTRTYRDALGLCNQRAAAEADEVYLMVSGLPLRLKPWT